MLQKLHIQNFALIDHLQIEFEDGFSVITGETGSGKSILLGALGLILGDRFERASVRDKDKKCIVEGSFSISESDYKENFSKFDLDFDPETIVRREISPSGKSRAFINDTPVSLTILRDICSLLIDIHSQHETLMINNPKFIIDLIDSQIEGFVDLSNYRKEYFSYVTLSEKLEELIQKENDAQNQKDFISFLVNEFEEHDLNILAESNIEEEYKLLSNAEDIKRKLDTVSELLNSNSPSQDIISNLKLVQSELNSLSSINQQFSELSERANSSLIELQDIANECSQVSDSTELDERTLVDLEEKMSFINRLLHKHQLSNTDQLLEKYNSLKNELSGIDNLSEKIVEVQQELKEIENKLSTLAANITTKRSEISKQLQEEAKNLLKLMNMKNAEIEFRFEQLAKFGHSGLDNIQLYVKTNLGGSYEPLKKIASGGETSRIMLAIKSLQSRSRSLPTIIFDEIDTGVSGEVANKMGQIMDNLGTKMQVISITHLPQIAAKGNVHYKVFKKEEEEQTLTNIIRLNNQERLNEIAELLSGSEVSAAALKNAQELLETKFD